MTVCVKSRSYFIIALSPQHTVTYDNVRLKKKGVEVKLCYIKSVTNDHFLYIVLCCGNLAFPVKHAGGLLKAKQRDHALKNPK